jgi:transcriptional regulator with XRE-family HTH domain
VAADDPWQQQLQSLGQFIRTQRRLANLTLREMAALTKVSNPYLSQVERGLHEPSVRVLKAIASALNVSAETLLTQAGLLETVSTGEPAKPPQSPVEAAIRLDPDLTDAQKDALLGVYRSFKEARG